MRWWKTSYKIKPSKWITSTTIFLVTFSGTLLYLQAAIDQPKSLIISKYSLTWEFFPLQLFSLFIAPNFWHWTGFLFVFFFVVVWLVFSHLIFFFFFFVLLSQDVQRVSPTLMKAFRCRTAFYHLVASGCAAGILTVIKYSEVTCGSMNSWHRDEAGHGNNAPVPCAKCLHMHTSTLLLWRITYIIFRLEVWSELLVPPAKDLKNQERGPLVE